MGQFNSSRILRSRSVVDASLVSSASFLIFAYLWVSERSLVNFAGTYHHFHRGGIYIHFHLTPPVIVLCLFWKEKNLEFLTVKITFVVSKTVSVTYHCCQRRIHAHLRLTLLPAAKNRIRCHLTLLEIIRFL